VDTFVQANGTALPVQRSWRHAGFEEYLLLNPPTTEYNRSRNGRYYPIPSSIIQTGYTAVPSLLPKGALPCTRIANDIIYRMSCAGEERLACTGIAVTSWLGHSIWSSASSDWQEELTVECIEIWLKELLQSRSSVEAELDIHTGLNNFLLRVREGNRRLWFAVKSMQHVAARSKMLCCVSDDYAHVDVNNLVAACVATRYPDSSTSWTTLEVECNSDLTNPQQIAKHNDTSTYNRLRTS
jgi:hypothetical protein